VTDPLNYRIKVFSPEGQLVGQIGKAGDVPGELNKPKGVAIDSDGHLYVCDSLQDTVQMFDNNGALVLNFGSNGNNDGQFWMPSGIFIDSRDYIYVADTYNQRIQVFRYISKTRREGMEEP
jgi:DNA-binding beta-propeller fold protein YncE